MKQFEYLCELFRDEQALPDDYPEEKRERFNDWIDKSGGVGWELINVDRLPDGSIEVVFKREIDG